MAIKRKVNAKWKGSGKEGKGQLNSQNDFFNDTPYSFKSRFENEDGKLGTNPEELIAGAHAGCFAMAMSVALSESGAEIEDLNVDATVSLDKTEEGFAINKIVLDLEGKVSGIGESDFLEQAKQAKNGCPISKALKSVPIELNAKFLD